MRVYIELSSSLIKYKNGEYVDFDDRQQADVQTVLDKYDLPAQEIGFVLRQGLRLTLDETLEDGDSIKVYPPIITG